MASRSFGIYSIRPGNFKTIATKFFLTELYGTNVSNCNSMTNSTLLAAARNSHTPTNCKTLYKNYIFHKNAFST